MLKIMFVFSVASFFAGVKVHALAIEKSKKRDFVLLAFAYAGVAAIFALVIF